MENNDDLGSLIEDMGELGITKPEVDIRYGVGKRAKFIAIDEELVVDFTLFGGDKIRRVRGEAFASSIDLEVVTSKEHRIKFRFIYEKVKPVATHVEFYYTEKNSETKRSLLNGINSITMNSYFLKYMEGKYSPVELFYICINLTSLGDFEESQFIIRDNKSEPAINGKALGYEDENEDKDDGGLDDLFHAFDPSKLVHNPISSYGSKEYKTYAINKIKDYIRKVDYEKNYGWKI